MPRRTIYVREADQPLWERAEQLAPDNLSALLTAALRDYVQRLEGDELTQMVELHGPVKKRVLYVWGSRYPDGRSGWGTSFDSRGTGPDQAAGLVGQMKRDPSIRCVQVEERRVYGDNWVDREPREEWTRRPNGWNRVL